MFVAANLISSIAWLIDNLLWIYTIILVIRALISWVNPDPWNPVVQFLYKATEPVLDPVRRRLGTYGMGIDFSPLIVILIVEFLRRFLVQTLYQFAARIS